jgi:hypothetical protein
MLSRRDFVKASGLLMPLVACARNPRGAAWGIPAGARALNYLTRAYSVNPTYADVSFTNTPTTALYSGYYANGASPPDSSHFLTGGGPLTMQLGSDGKIGHVSAQRLNSTQGLLPYLLGSSGFYFEATAQVNSYTSDAWLAVWAMPKEHDFALSDTLSIPPAPAGSVNYEGFGEIDACESGFGSYSQNLNSVLDHHGTYSGLPTVASASQTVANPGVFTTASQAYTSGLMVHLSGTAPGGFSLNVPYFVSATGLSSTTCQLSATLGGASIQCTASASCNIVPSYINITQNNVNVPAVIDFTQPHRFGASYDPIGKNVTWWQDDVQVSQKSVAGYCTYEIDPYHWYQIISCQTHGANTPYQVTFSNLQAWTP